MKVQFEIPEKYLEPAEIEKLKELFNIKDDKEFEEAINKIVLASLKEYVDMFSGMGLPSRADEIRQHRLHHLIKYYFPNRIPSEAEVSSMFQLTQTRSRALIEQTITRFHYDLEPEITHTLIDAVNEAQFDEDNHYYTVVIQSDNVLERLNLIIAKEAPKLDPIRKVRNMTRTYTISEDSNDVLRKFLKIPIERK